MSIKYLVLFLLIFSLSTPADAQRNREDAFAEIKKLLEEQSNQFEESEENDSQTDSLINAGIGVWDKDWVLNLSGNQAAYENWSQGGVNSIAATISTSARFRYTTKSISNTTRINLQLGQTWLDGDDSRKTADLINLKNKVNYFLGTRSVSAFAEVDFRTQFVRGFDNNNENVVSSFLAPGYLTESFGVSYQPRDFVSGQIGIGLKQTFVRVDSLDIFYGLDEDVDIRSEGGFTISIDLDKDFAETFNYTAELNTFTNLRIPIRSTDIIFRNELSGKLNNFLTTVIQFEIMYDDDVSTRLQLRQAIAVGLNIKLL